MKASDNTLSLLLLASAALVLAPLPLFVGNGTLRYLTDLCLLIAVAQLWNLLAGYGGIVSIGQHAFVGAGAYAFFGFAVLTGIHPFVAMALTLPFGMLLSVPVFAVVIRLRTAYFAIGSWVVAEVLSLTAGKLPGFGGGSGFSMPPDVVRAFGSDVTSRIHNVYWLALAILVAIVFLIIKILNSRHGLALKAIRDNETAAMALGVNPVVAKAVLFMISGGFLALLGAVNTLQKLRINPTASFSLTDWTVFIIFIVVIGGIGRIWGPIIGAVLFVVLRENLSGYGSAYMILLGAVAIVMMLVEPGGIAALLSRGWSRIVRVRPGSVSKPIAEGHRLTP